MSTSPLASSGASSPITESTTAAGTMIHTARGGVSASSSSAALPAARAPNAATALTFAALRSYATHSCPPCCRRRTMLAPMRPSPIIPMRIAATPSLPLQPAKVTSFAGGNGADVRRNRLRRFRPIQLVRDAPDLGSELRELLFDGFVTAIDVIDALHLGASLGDQAREHQ